MEKLNKQMTRYHIPRWKELPDIDLYMDQILGFLEEHTKMYNNTEEKLITKSMINNYVKLGLIEAPIKKKYNKTQMASLLMITILKKILTMNEIKALIYSYNKKLGAEKAYNLFCEEQEKAIEEALEDIEKKESSMKVAAKALAGKVVAEKIIFSGK